MSTTHWTTEEVARERERIEFILTEALRALKERDNELSGVVQASLLLILSFLIGGSIKGLLEMQRHGLRISKELFAKPTETIQ